MTICQAIKMLSELKAKHGDVQVYFDCPKCDISFSPTTAVGTAIHLTEKVKV